MDHSQQDEQPSQPWQGRQQPASTSGRSELQSTRGLGGSIGGSPHGSAQDLPPLGVFNTRSSLPSSLGSSREPPPVAGPPLRKGLSSIGSSYSIGGPPTYGGLGQGPGPGHSLGPAASIGGLSVAGSASSSGSIGGSIGGAGAPQWPWGPGQQPQLQRQQGPSIGGPSLNRPSGSIGTIGPRQSTGSGPYPGFSGQQQQQPQQPQGYGQYAQPLGGYGPQHGHLIGAGPSPKGPSLASLGSLSSLGGVPTSHQPPSIQPPVSYPSSLGYQPFTGQPALAHQSSGIGALPQPKFPIGGGGGYALQGGTLADSVTSLNMSQGSNVNQSKAARERQTSFTPPAAKVKVICNSGGHFVRLPKGAFEYQGGETRLVSVRSGCNHKELLSALDRVMACPHRSGSSDSEGGPQLRFQLPNERNTYVDLVDDEDVQLMFDEWADYVASPECVSSSKLQVFVDWQRTTPRAAGSPLQARPKADGERHERHSAASGAPSDESSAQMTSQGQTQTSSTAALNKATLLVSDRLEIISPHDVSLVKFLGSGGYGEVYLGKWHSSEAAIKCLNASLFYPGGDGSQRPNHAAMTELLREAEIMARLRHPNIVLVYGVVLPEAAPELPPDDDDDEFGLDPLGPIQIGAVVAARGPDVKGGVKGPAIVTEFLSQGSLRGVLARKSDVINGPLVRVLIAMDAAKGMEYLHSKKIVHFDLKSANLLLGHRDRRTICKVADFGLSKQKMDTYVSGVSSQRGTLPWIAPEIIKSPHAVNELVDVYSFGIVLWELWTGREPYEGLNYHALLHQITSANNMRPPLPGTPEYELLGEGSPPEPAAGFCTLVQACWDEKPQHRPTFTSIVSSLKRMASDLRPQRRASQPGGEQPARPVAAAAQPFAQAPSPQPGSPAAAAPGQQ